MSVDAAATPSMTVNYGAFAIDESNGCLITSNFVAEDSPEAGSFYVEFRCRLVTQTGVKATDDAAFAVKILALEALKVPRLALLAKFGASSYRSWSSADGSAFLMQPTLTILEKHSRDWKFGWRLTAQLPGNIVGNVFRRDSRTKTTTSVHERRTCVITANWTASNGVTALGRYNTSGDAFYNSYLPANLIDQHSITGVWVRMDEDPEYEDSNALIQATRVYWECFSGRRESETVTLTTIGDRRVCAIASSWLASGSSTALQNYTSNGGAFYTAQLPTPVSSGAWVLVGEHASYVDTIGTMQVIRTYHEAVNGLRESQVQVTTDAAGLRHLEISGAYYSTGVSARTNYTNNIQTFVTACINAESPTISNFEATSVPKIERYDQNQQRLTFTWTINELAYPQGVGWDDDNVTLNTLDIDVDRNFDPQSITAANPVTRMKTCTARFVATINIRSSGGDNPATLWANGLRAAVLAALQAKLGADVTTVGVVRERVGVGLHANQLVGTLECLVTNGTPSILWLRLRQKVVQYPGRRFIGMADGEAWSFYPGRRPPAKKLIRSAACEFVIGQEPVLFDVSDNVASGYGLIDTGITAQDSIDSQNDPGTFDLGGVNWVIDPDASEPYSVEVEPTSRGDDDGFETAVATQGEVWFYAETIAAGTSIA